MPRLTLPMFWKKTLMCDLLTVENSKEPPQEVFDFASQFMYESDYLVLSEEGLMVTLYKMHKRIVDLESKLQNATTA